MIPGTSTLLTSLCCDTTDVEHIEQFSAFSMLNRTAIAVSRVMRWKFFHNLLKNQGILHDSRKVLDHSSEYYMASEHLNTAVS